MANASTEWIRQGDDSWVYNTGQSGTTASTTVTTQATQAEEETQEQTTGQAQDVAEAAGEAAGEAAVASITTCSSDEFQGFRFYDGASYGYVRVHEDKVELLVDEPLEYEGTPDDPFDGTKPHTYRVTGRGKDVKLYIDGVLAIDGTGKFSRTTSERIVEFGDIAGREQSIGSTWDSFRYSIAGAIAPTSDTTSLFEEVAMFPSGSIGTMRAYDDALYMSYDPSDPLHSSTVYKYEESDPPETRAVLAVTKSMATSVLADPNRQGSVFGTTGKLVGTDSGLQYILGSKAAPFEVVTKNNLPPEDQGWQLETSCSSSCASMFGDALNIDTRRETGGRFHKYVQRRRDDAWITQTSNARGWTVEARVKVVDDGSVGIDAPVRTGKDYVFLSYFGETMTPDKSEMAKRALDLMLMNMGPNDRFNVISFSGVNTPWSEGLVDSTRYEISSASEFVDALYAQEGANLTGAFTAAFGQDYEQSDKVVILVSDGSTDTSAATVEPIVTAANAAGPNAQIFCLGIGTSIFNQSPTKKEMLEDIASNNAGASKFASTDNDLDNEVLALWKEITPDYSFDGTGPRGSVVSRIDTGDGSDDFEAQQAGVEPDDDIEAPAIVVNDGVYQEIVQFFNGGIRLKYANVFAPLNMSQQYQTIRIVGKDRSIAVFAKADGDQMFRRMLYAEDALYVRASVAGEQERADVAVDSTGFAHAVWQDSEGGSWRIMYSKTAPDLDDIKSSGTGTFSTSSPNLIASSAATFVASGVQAGDIIVLYGNKETVVPLRTKVKEVLNDNNLLIDGSVESAGPDEGTLSFVIFTGRTEWTPPLVISTQSLDSYNPRIMLHSSNVAYVAYDNDETANKEIHLRRINYSPAYGVPEDSVQITNARFDSKEPDLAETASGNIFLAWSDARNDETKSEIFGCVIDPGTLLEVSAQRSFTGDSSEARNPRVIRHPAIPNQTPSMLVAYQDLVGSYTKIRTFRVTGEETMSVSSIQTISDAVGGNNSFPSIATNGKKALVAWQNDALGTSSICSSWLDQNETIFSSAERVTRGRGESVNCDVLVDASGAGYVSFQDDRSRTGYPSIYYARYSAADEEWLSSSGRGMEARIDTYMTRSARPAMAMDEQGVVTILYEAEKDEVTSRIASCLVQTGSAIKPSSFSPETDDFVYSGVNYDNSLVGYFPLDDDDSDLIVENKIRRKSAIPPPLEIIIVLDTSSGMSAEALTIAKSAASEVISLLGDADSLEVITSERLASNGEIIRLFGSLQPATTANKATAQAFVASPSGTTEDAASGSLIEAVGYSFTASSVGAVIVLSQGETTDAQGGAVDPSAVSTYVPVLQSANELDVAIFSYSYQPTNYYLLEQVAINNGGVIIDVPNEEYVPTGEERLVGALTQAQLIGAEYVMAPPEDGESSVATNVLHVAAPDDGISLMAPATQGAFDLSADGNVFSVPYSLVGRTGAIEFWMRPHWASTDVGTMVFCGNSSLTSTTSNTMCFGSTAVGAGNALRFRIVDAYGYVHQTEVQNAPGSTNFSWSANDPVHVRVAWDNHAIGTSSLNDVSFVDASTGFACGALGAIFKTTDGGATWVQKTSGVTYDLFSIDFVDASNGMAVGEMGTLLKTTDGGESWTDTGGVLDEDINGVYVRTTSVAFAVGSGGTILRTDDGAATWDSITTGAIGDLRDVALAREFGQEAVIVIGAGGQIYRSTDDGLHFMPVGSVYIPAGAPASTEYMRLSKTHQAGNYKSYIVGRSGMILRTTDGGDSWSATVLNLSVNPSLYGVAHGPDSDDVYAVGQDGLVLRSSDAGDTWVMYGTEVENGALRAIEANFGGAGSGLDMLAVGVGGSVVRSSDGGAIQVYSVTKSGNLTIYINGKEPTQVRTGDVPFDWEPQLDLYFGDYQASGTDTANAVIDELMIYEDTTPSPGSVMRRKNVSGVQPNISSVIHRVDLEKRIEWGHVNPIAASSYWTDVRLSLCASFEPLQVFSWNTQLGMSDDVVRDMAIDQHNRLWMATENGISTANLNELNDDIERWLNGERQVNNKPGRFVNFTNLGDGLPVDSVSSICVDENNDIWAGTDTAGLMYLIRNSTASSWSDSTQDPVESSKEDSIDDLEGSVIQRMTSADGLASDSVLTVRPIKGGVAVGTRGGLTIVSIEKPLTEDDLSTLAGTNVAETVTGQTSQQTTRAIITEGSPTTQGATSEVVTTETTDSEGTTSATDEETNEDKIQRLSTTRITTITSYGILDGLPSTKIQAIGQEDDGTLWVGTDRGLVKFNRDASTTFTVAEGMSSDDVSSIFFEPDEGKRYVGTSYGLTVISGSTFTPYVSEGLGIGVILDGTIDANGVKWMATSVGLVEMREDCDNVFRRYTVEDGLLGDDRITDFKYYLILGNELPWGGCDKVLVMATVNGESAFGTYRVDASVPFIIFDEPLGPSDKVEAFVYHGWREIRNFSTNVGNFEDRAVVNATRAIMPLYRARFDAGDVVLGGNLADGASNQGALMYGLFVVPSSGTSNPISSISTPSGAVVMQGVSSGDVMYTDDTTDKVALPANEIRDSFHVVLPSAGQSDDSDEYVRMTLSAASWVYVAYDSRGQPPFWMRNFEAMPSTYRVVDMETYDGNGVDKLYVGLSGSNGCVYDILHDPTICDISDTIAMDEAGPVGCAAISRINSVTNITLTLTATDEVSGVADMQVSAREDFKDSEGNDLPWITFAPTYNLELPQDVAVTELVDEIEPIPPAGLDQEATGFYEYDGRILIMTRDPGRVYELDASTGDVALLFTTNEDEVTSLAAFAGKLLVGTSSNGRVYTWDGTTLTQAFEFPGEGIRSMASFDSTLFLGSSPNGRVYAIDEAMNLSLFKDTYEESVNDFAILGTNLFWVTSNGGVSAGSTLRTTTTNDHAHSIEVSSGVTSLSGVNGTTSESDGHTHAVANGILAVADNHTHVLNGSRPGRVFKYNPISGLVNIVHADKDYSMNVIGSVPERGLLFAATYPNGKIYRYVSGEDLFIKSFDTAHELVSALRASDGRMYAAAEDDVYFFDGQRWQFMTGTGNDINDVGFLPGRLLMLHDNSVSTLDAAVDGAAVAGNIELCAYVRFRDGVGNISTVKNDDGTWITCYNPCVGLTLPGADDPSTTGQGGAILNHRLVEIDGNAREVFSINGDIAFLSGNKVEAEIAVYESEIFNGTSSLVQWRSIEWDATTPAGTSVTLAVRSSSTSAGVLTEAWSPEMTNPSGNDITNQAGQFLQFRATLTASRPGVLSPELHEVRIQMRTAQAVHYFTTHFRLPNDLRRGLLTYNGCLNPPSTDIVFGISGKDTTDFSEYFVITPNKVFEVPPEHQNEGFRVGIKLISDPTTVPVVDEFALLFSLANDAIVKLNLPGSPGSSGPAAPTGTTRTVVTTRTMDHAHTLTFDALITDKFLISGTTSSNASHSHEVINGVVQASAGHTHDFSI